MMKEDLMVRRPLRGVMGCRGGRGLNFLLLGKASQVVGGGH